MDINKLGSKILEMMRKYKYPLLVLLIGITLMVIPGKTDTYKEETVDQTQITPKADSTQELTDILRQIQGVGEVQVLLTIAAGESTIYHSDEDVSDTDAGSTIRKETVIITDSDRNEKPLIDQVLPPTYLGAVIVCQGADSAQVRLAIVDAVMKATGLGADRIAVLKMK